MIIAIASDHGGYQLKETIRKYLASRGLKVVDLGTNSEESVDYPIYGKACAEAVASGKADRGIVVCGTGIGISMAANKVHGIRCGLCTSVEMAELTRKHNNANMLAAGHGVRGRPAQAPDGYARRNVGRRAAPRRNRSPRRNRPTGEIGPPPSPAPATKTEHRTPRGVLIDRSCFLGERKKTWERFTFSITR